MLGIHRIPPVVRGTLDGNDGSVQIWMEGTTPEDIDRHWCDRQQWATLNELDEPAIRQRLEPYLTSKQISRLLLRRTKLINHIQKQIDKNGEDAVLFDLDR